MKTITNEELICLQVDFSENFRLGNQDAVQNSFYSQDAVSLFTSHICASLDNLFSQLKQQFQHLKEIHVFSDGATQHFK
ncbi:unnamed protein product [Rotaria sp. Silwood1]|nr:unnamed protein product [Rotaria sp. Silwood1]